MTILSVSFQFPKIIEKKNLMEASILNLRKYFRGLSNNILKKIYKARCERLRVLMINGIPDNIRFIIEAKIRLDCEAQEIIIKQMPGFGKSSYAKKRRAKNIGGCYKCARWTCNGGCRNVGMTSANREDKILFIKNGLSKEPLDEFPMSLETHSSGYVQTELLKLWIKFYDEKNYYIDCAFDIDPVCRLAQKLGISTPTKDALVCYSNTLH